MTTGLIIILLLVLCLPFLLKTVERNLEIFLSIMGVLAAIISGVLNRELIRQAVTDPLNITLAVFISSLLFKWLKEPIEHGMLKVRQYMSIHIFLVVIIVVIGLLSSLITAIISAIVLVSIISILPIDRKTEIRAVVLSCFSIGFGSVLTPIGEPLATITTNKLNADFFYLFQLVGKEVIIAVLAIGVFAFFFLKPKRTEENLHKKKQAESFSDIVNRSSGIYLFIMGLTLLGASFETLVNQYLLGLHTGLLYWINMVSAVLDNATLAAAEITPAMNTETIRFILLSLVISGGMLIPGNIPNIISANKLGITSKEWAKHGLPLGLLIMSIVFIYLIL
ncbi:DUF1646 family protein [Oceanobacillus halophilus]|uniref:DUF1646 domain-containing protein n=1 Tax=Oceanobacillus halophilus TaxID=930130 RepID=A0A495A5P9_9BACI|nr:DUF1646 family protein [Oceanobacillus halophilus]RKQ34680.1 DUF1646 domain-containing protein [Oceanobacillus halophilus]